MEWVAGGSTVSQFHSFCVTGRDWLQLIDSVWVARSTVSQPTFSNIGGVGCFCVFRAQMSRLAAPVLGETRFVVRAFGM